MWYVLKSVLKFEGKIFIFLLMDSKAKFKPCIVWIGFSFELSMGSLDYKEGELAMKAMKLSMGKSSQVKIQQAWWYLCQMFGCKCKWKLQSE